MLGVDGVGDRRCWAILARNFSVENWERQEERKRAYEKKERGYPNSRAQPPRSGDCVLVLAQFPSKKGEQRSIHGRTNSAVERG